MELFKNFKDDYSDFKSSIQMWESATDIEIYKSKKSGWKNLKTSEFDGNPILFYYNYEEKRGIRVIQNSSFENNEKDFNIWIDNFGDKNSINGIELVVSSSPNEINIEKYKQLISIWLKDKNAKLEDLKK